MTNGKTFEQLFEESIKNAPGQEGDIIKGNVIDIGSDYVIIDSGFKSESYLPIEQFTSATGELEISVGDIVDVALEAIENGHGETRLSRDKAKRLESWARLEEAHQNDTIVKGVINGRVKGGFTVDIGKVRAFLPGSLLDVKPVKDVEALEGIELEFKVIKVDTERNNIVVSRKAVVEAESNIERDALLETLEEGQEIKGIVKNLTDYGAFIDLGGIDGLLHITDISWKRIKHPGELLSIGDEILVKVLKFDKENARVSLGLKQLGEDPWLNIARRYPVGTRIFGKITNITDYGCFVEIEHGIEGLVHVSEMDWTNKNINPNKILHLGQEVEVVVLDNDEERRRISLGMKQCLPNPWIEFAENHQKGEKITDKIKSITDFGIFIGLDGNIDGLVHLSDISWQGSMVEDMMQKYRKGDEVDAVILAIDADKERISLGIKQLEADHFSEYLAENPKDSMVKGEITEVDDKEAKIKLTDQVTGRLTSKEMLEGDIADLSKQLKVGDELELRVVGVDRKSRTINLSLKPKSDNATKEKSSAKKKSSRAQTIKATLGDIFREQIGTKKETETKAEAKEDKEDKDDDKRKEPKDNKEADAAKETADKEGE